MLPVPDVHQDKIKLGPRPTGEGYERPPRDLFHYVPDHAATVVK